MGSISHLHNKRLERVHMKSTPLYSFNFLGQLTDNCCMLSPPCLLQVHSRFGLFETAGSLLYFWRVIFWLDFVAAVFAEDASFG